MISRARTACGSPRRTPGLLWIQTDDGAYTDVTNCMMLAALPGKTGDGAPRTITNVDGASSSTVTTYVGKAGGEQKLRRFLVGPKECEITGIAETPGRQDAVRQHPASWREHAAELCDGRLRQPLAGWRRGAAALGDHRDHAR